MAISKNLEIKVSNEQASFNEKFYVYQNDRGIDLYIKIVIPKLQIGGRNTSMLSEFDGAKAGVTIVKPNGNIIGKSKMDIVDDAIKFVIDKDLTDDLDEVGIYRMQFHLYDENDNRITIPPVEFEVKALIGIIP